MKENTTTSAKGASQIALSDLTARKEVKGGKGKKDKPGHGGFMGDGDEIAPPNPNSKGRHP